MLLALLLLVVGVSQVHAQGIRFEKVTWEQVQYKAKKTNKYVFVDAYTTWCGPCKWMAAKIFTQKEVGDFYDVNFIAYKMDMEKGDGPAFAKKHGVVAYPTLLFFSPNGELVHKAIGGRDAEGFLELSKAALDPDKQLLTQREKYEKGENAKSFMLNYINVLVDAGEPVIEVFDKYWASKYTESKNIDIEDFSLLKKVHETEALPFEHKIIQAVIEGKKGLVEQSDQKTFEQFEEILYSSTTFELAALENSSSRSKGAKAFVKKFPKYKAEFSKRVELFNCMMKHRDDEKRIKKALDTYMKVATDWNMLNQVAWQAYESEDAPKELKVALNRVNRSISLNENFYNLDTKAALLFKLKNYTEALNVADEAIAAGVKIGDDVSATEELKSEIQKAMK